MTTPTSSNHGSTVKVEVARMIRDQAADNLQKYALNPIPYPQDSLNVTLTPRGGR